MKTKEEIRRVVRQRRKDLNQMWVELRSIEAQRRFLELPQFRRAEVVCCYLAMHQEVKTDRILEECWKSGRTVCVPAYDRAREYYRLAVFKKEIPVIEGRWRVWEPALTKWISIDHVDIIVVPGLAFDRAGGRLGHGGGHYDRILRRDTKAVSVFKVGMGFDFQIVDSVPMDMEDVRMDVVVTESALYEADKASL